MHITKAIVTYKKGSSIQTEMIGIEGNLLKDEFIALFLEKHNELSSDDIFVVNCSVIINEADIKDPDDMPIYRDNVKDGKAFYAYINLNDADTELVLEARNEYRLIADIFCEENLIVSLHMLKYMEYALKHEFEAAMERMTDQEKILIKLRYGLDDNHFKTLQETGDIVGLSRERVRQVSMKALRKLRHPIRSRVLGKMFYSQKYKPTRQQSVISEDGKLVEQLIINDIQSYLEESTQDTESLLSNKIIESIKIHLLGKEYLELLKNRMIEDADLTIRTRNILERAGIKTYYDLVLAPDDVISGFRNMGHTSRHEAVSLKNALIKTGINEDEDIIAISSDIFESQNEIPVTRFGLTSKQMLYWIERGYLYLSDILQVPNYCRQENIGTPFSHASESGIEKIMMTGEPYIRVKIPSAMVKHIKEREIKNYNDIIWFANYGNPIVKTQCKSILKIVRDANAQYDS